jgi:hypothetical protein
MEQRYAVRFDFPELDGGFVYGAVLNNGAAFTTNINNAQMFEEADRAVLFLRNAYGENTGLYGRVATGSGASFAARMSATADLSCSTDACNFSTLTMIVSK